MFIYVLGFVLSMLCVYKIAEAAWHFWLIRDIPAPNSYPIIGNVVNFIQPPDKLFDTLAQYGREYGPIYRISIGLQTFVLLNSPEDIEIVISSMKNLNKNFVYHTVQFLLKEGLATSTAKKWQERRKMLTPAFHFNMLKKFTPILIEKSEDLAYEIGNSLGKIVDVAPLFAKFTFLSICETAMGANIDPVRIEEYRQDINTLDHLLVERLVRPWLYPPIFFLFSTLYFKIHRVLRRVHMCTESIIKARKRNFNYERVSAMSVSEEVETDSVYKGKTRLAMLDMLLAANFRNEIDMKGVQEEVDTFVGAGYDTTASCLSFTLFALACNKHIQDKVAEELRELLPNKEDKVTLKILNDMKYLERVIKESLRLYPSVATIGRVTSETIRTHTGYTLPAGTTLFLRIYDLHRNPEIYPEPEKFDPDRFLPEEIEKRHPFAYIPFSAGPRNCIGQKFARLELKALLSAILRHFEVLPVDTPNTVQFLLGIVLHTKDGLRVKFVPRSNK